MATLANRSAVSTEYSFEPHGAIYMSLSTSSTAATALVGQGEQIVITNLGDEYAFIDLSDSTANATTSSRICVPPGDQLPFTLPFIAGTNETNRATHAAGLALANTTTVHISRGIGR